MSQEKVNQAEVVPFKFNESSIRSVVIDFEPWFVAKDVCQVLGIKNHNRVVGELKSNHSRGYVIRTPLGGNQTTSIVSESGLYSLIFKSRKQEAEEFQEWITSEVLPSLRKKGYYSDPTKPYYGTYQINEYEVRFVELNGEKWTYIRDYMKAHGIKYPKIKKHKNQRYSQRLRLIGGTSWCANESGTKTITAGTRVKGIQLTLFNSLKN